MSKTSIRDEVCNQLLEKIKKRELIKGEKLPSECELGTMFGVSRTSIRAALQNLQGRGVIDTVQGVGSFVNIDVEENSAKDKQKKKASDISSREFQEFFEFRQAIEFRAIDFFVKRADTIDQKRLKAALDGIKLAGKQGDLTQFSRMDYAFHMAIIKGAKNNFLVEAMQDRKEFFKHYLAEIARVSDKPVSDLAEEHEELYTCLVEKKAKEAKGFLFADNMFYRLAYFNMWVKEVSG